MPVFGRRSVSERPHDSHTRIFGWCMMYSIVTRATLLREGLRLVDTKVRVLPALGAQMMCSFARKALKNRLSSRSTRLREAKLGVPSWPCRACPRWRPWGAAYRWACHADLGAISVVVLPSGTPMRCFREDMVIPSVFEVWAMVPRGLPHHHHRREGGQGGLRGSKIESPRK